MAVNASAALATQVRQTSMILFHQFTKNLEPAAGDDPTTCGLQNRRSTNVSYTGKTRHMLFLRPNAIKKIAVCAENGGNNGTHTHDNATLQR